MPCQIHICTPSFTSYPFISWSISNTQTANYAMVVQQFHCLEFINQSWSSLSVHDYLQCGIRICYFFKDFIFKDLYYITFLSYIYTYNDDSWHPLPDLHTSRLHCPVFNLLFYFIFTYIFFCLIGYRACCMSGRSR